MSAIVPSAPCNHANVGWQASFVSMLPQLQAGLHREFSSCRAEARDDAVGEGLAACLKMYARLHEREETQRATAGTLVRFAAKQVRAGRGVGRSMNSHDALSPSAPIRRHGWTACESGNDVGPDWVKAAIESRRSSIPEQVALRIDVPDWLRRLSRRMQQIARDLAIGCTTGEVARKHGVTAARISQIRSELYTSWQSFQHGIPEPSQRRRRAAT